MTTRSNLKVKMADLVGRQIVAVSVDYDPDDDFRAYLQVESMDFPPVRLPLDGLDYFVNDYTIGNLGTEVKYLHDEGNALKLVDCEEEPIVFFDVHRLSAKWQTENFFLRQPLTVVGMTPRYVSLEREDGASLYLQYGVDGFRGLQVGDLPDVDEEGTHTVRMTAASGMEVGLVFE